MAQNRVEEFNSKHIHENFCQYLFMKIAHLGLSHWYQTTSYHKTHSHFYTGLHIRFLFHFNIDILTCSEVDKKQEAHFLIVV